MKKESKIIFLGLLLAIFYGCSNSNNGVDSNNIATDSIEIAIVNTKEIN